MGHIIRWKDDGDLDGPSFRWNHFVLAGDPANERADAKGNVKGDAFGCPDGLWVDGRGVLWIQTDMSTSAMGKGDLARLGNNCMLAADPRSGEIRRFLVGPAGCEVTGAAGTPDGRTMFVNIQHPGESPSERSDPDQPRRFSNWPDQNPVGPAALGHGGDPQEGRGRSAPEAAGTTNRPVALSPAYHPLSARRRPWWRTGRRAAAARILGSTRQRIGSVERLHHKSFCASALRGDQQPCASTSSASRTRTSMRRQG